MRYIVSTKFTHIATRKPLNLERKHSFVVTLLLAAGFFLNPQWTLLGQCPLDAGQDVTICYGDSTQLQATVYTIGTYSWSPVTGLNDPGIANPIATPLVTTPYIVTYTDSLCITMDTVLVTVHNTVPYLSFTPPDTLFAECGSPLPFIAPVFADSCDNNLTVTLDTVLTLLPCAYRVTRLWVATNAQGNSASFRQTVNIFDITPPVIGNKPPAVLSFSCGSQVPPPATVTATDICDSNVSISFRQDSIASNPCSYILERTWTATDDCGNSSVYRQIIAVEDNVMPVISGVPPDITVACSLIPSPAPVTATDNCGAANLTFLETKVPGLNPCDTIYTRTWTAVDNCGNTTVETQTITATDSKGPLITMTHPMLVGISQGDTLYLTCKEVSSINAKDVLITDDCCTDITVDFQQYITASNCPQSGYIQLMRIVWVATDCCGNKSSFFFHVILRDNTPPVLKGVPGDVTYACPGTLSPIPVVTAVDDCDNAVVITLKSDTTQLSCGYKVVHTWTAADACGNKSSQSQTITWNDILAPVIANVPADILISCPSQIPPIPNNITITDNCDTSPVLTYMEMTSGSGCLATIMRTWTATDRCGNKTVRSQNILIHDKQAPDLFGLPKDTTVNCNSVPRVADVIAFDNCSGIVPVTFNETISGSDCSKLITRTWRAEDACGNAVIGTQIILVVDIIAPVFSGVPANISLQCGSTPAAPPAVLVFDNCSANLSATFQESSSGFGCSQKITRTWTAIDACGNLGTATQVISFVDTEKPVLSGVPANISMECGSLVPPATVTATDLCDGTLPVQYNQTTVGQGCGRILIRTWTATDACGNTVTASQTITFFDTEKPVLIGIPLDISVECGAQPAPASALVTAIDACDGLLAVTYTEATTGTGCKKVITRTWSAVDACGNSGSASQRISMTDTQKPVLAGVPASTTIECGLAIPPANVTATDNCDGAIAVILSESRAPNGCNSLLTRTWTATDSCGNIATASQTIGIVDTKAPVLAGVPSDLSIECGATVPVPNVTATDQCGGVMAVSYSEVTTGSGCNKLILRTWTSIDACGNTAFATQVITVLDSQKPVLAGVPSDTSLPCGSPVPPASVTATDVCDGNLAVGYNETKSGSGCNRILIRTWSASDACGNTVSAAQIISFTDIVKPVLAGVPASTSLPCGSAIPPANVTATDACDGNLAFVYSESYIGSGCNRLLTRTWSATDACGNTATAIQAISFTDTDKPVLLGVPANLSLECGTTVPSATVTATDNCDKSVGVAYTETNTGSGCNKLLTRTWTAVDSCGNTAAATQVITFTDTAKPVLTGVPSNITIECGSPIPSASVSATDACDGSIAVSLSAASATDGCNIILTRSWTATDACGNSVTASQTINIVDTQKPVLAGVPADITIECGALVPAPNVSATDRCIGQLIVSFSETTTGSGCNKKILRTWTSKDACGNVAFETQVITVVDTQKPVLTGVPINASLPCGSPVPPATVTATDACDGNLAVTYNEAPSGTGCNRILTRTWSATDACGNTASSSQIISFTDIIKPVLAGVPSNVSLPCGSVIPTANVTATDACDGNIAVVYSESYLGSGCNRLLTRSWSATDACGNTATASQLITFIDTEKPVLLGVPVDLSLECGTAVPSTPVTATDNCDAAVQVTLIETNTGSGCNKTLTRTWTAVDSCGNTGTAKQVITFIDTAKPVLSGVPANITLECGAPIPTANVTATDACDGNILVSLSASAAADGCNTLLTRRWTATDACGNSITASQTINIVDTHKPVLAGVPADITIECGTFVPVPNVSATDLCSGQLTVSFNETTTGSGCNQFITRTWTATDNCGNQAKAQQVITLEDKVAPKLSFTHPLLAGLSQGDSVWLSCSGTYQFRKENATASDNCNTTIIGYTEGHQKAADCRDKGYFGIVERTWTAIDLCGNLTSTTLYFLYHDDSPPEISSVPKDITVECGGIVPPFGEPFIDDLCGLSVVNVIDDSLSIYQGYQLIRTWQAIDDCGNISTASQKISVLRNSPPVLAGLPADTTIYLLSGQTVPAVATVTATDKCTGENVPVIYSDTLKVLPGGCDTLLVRTWTATSANGLSASGAQEITMVGGIEVNITTLPDTCTTGKGTAILSPTSLSYKWSDGFTGHQRNNLLAGAYIVSVSNGTCTDSVQILIANECQECKPLFSTDTLHAELIANQDTLVCVPVPYNISTGYDIFVNGSQYTDIGPCDNSTVVFYSYALVVGLGKSGPYQVTWKHNNTTLQVTVNNMDELVAAMNLADTLGKWEHNTLFLGFTSPNIGGNYGDMSIKHVVSQVTAFIKTNYSSTPMGASLQLPEGIHEVVYINKATQCKDTLIVAVKDVTPIVEDILPDKFILLTGLCDNGTLSYCLPIAYTELSKYSISINGAAYTGSYNVCEYTADHFYTYVAIPGLGKQGPYQLTGWKVGNQSYTGGFANIEELVVLMNTLNSNGNWKLHAATLTIRGGNSVVQYGSLNIVQTSTGAISVLELNRNFVPGNARIALPKGNSTVIAAKLSSGQKDTLISKVACVTPGFINTEIEVSQADTICLSTVELIGPVVSVVNICDEGIGNPVEYIIIPGSVCIINYGKYEGESMGCFVICDEFGVCDTTYINTTVKDRETILKADTLQTKMNQPVIGNILANDTIRGKLQSVRIVQQPKNGVVTVNVDNTVTYTPNREYCNDVEFGETDKFFYEVCTQYGCKTMMVSVIVKCEPFQIFTGFSPNGDGINDFFRIDGLQNYPNHELTIFNRWGNRVFRSKNYKNDWGGSWMQNDLPDGTYFYMLEDGEGEVYSGFIQIRR